MKILAVDSEYQMTNPAWAQPRGFSFCWKAGEARFVEWSAKGKELLQALLDEADIVIMHSQVADSVLFEANGIKVPFEKLECTLTMAHVLAKFESISLKALSYELLGIMQTTMDDLTSNKKIDIMLVPLPELIPYACADADCTWQIYPVLKKMLEERGLTHIYEEIEKPLFPIVVEMQLTGVKLDLDRLKKLGDDLDKIMSDQEAILLTYVKKIGKNGATADVPRFIYKEAVLKDGKVGYPRQKNNKTGRDTLDSKAISRLRQIEDHPFLAALTLFRQASKLKSTYVDGLPLQCCPNCGLLHPVFKQAWPKSGRFSSEYPNFQNIPVRTKLGARVRECFVTFKPGLWLGVDASQLELRILAIITKDPKLTRFFQNNEGDIHTWVSETAGIPRRATKVLTYGRIFQQSKKAAYTTVVTEYQEAGETPPTFASFEEFYEEHARVLSALPTHEVMVKEAIVTKGYVETYMGRQYWTSDLKGDGWRTACSHGPQGGGADWVKIVMPLVWKLNKEYGVRLFGQVHDELTQWIPPELLTYPGHVGRIHEYRHKLKKTMEEAVDWGVRINCDIKIGRTWSEAH